MKFRPESIFQATNTIQRYFNDNEKAEIYIASLNVEGNAKVIAVALLVLAI